MSSEAAPTPTRLFVCVVGVWLTWTAHDYLQERIFKAPGFRFGLFMAFSLQTVSFILSLAYRIGVGLLDRSQAQRGKEEEARRLRAVEEEEEQGAGLMEENEPPVETKPSGAEPLSALVWYLLLSLLIAAANGSASAALQYVNMQVKVLFKSSKIITVMLLGRLCFGRSYPCIEYGFMLLVCLGLIGFMLGSSADGSPLSAALPGVALLSLAVLSDSLVPNVQQRLLVTLSRPKHELVFHTNWVSALMTACYMWATGEGVAAVHFLRRRPFIALLLLVQSICGYLGILVYLETVQAYGSKVTTIVTSCRKLFTIGLSSLLFHHPLTPFHLAGVFAVFTGVLMNSHPSAPPSRVMITPAILLMTALIGLELRCDLSLLGPGWAPTLQPLHSALAANLMPTAQLTTA